MRLGKMLKALLDNISSESEYLAFFFVLGFILLPVVSWQSEYNKDCKETQEVTWQHLADSYQIDTPGKRGFYKELCLANMTVDGEISPSYKYLLTEEGKKELITWLTKWKDSDVLKYCEITSILFCEEREPTWVKVIKFIQMLFFGLWFLLVGVIVSEIGVWREWPLWLVFLGGLMSGWYTTQWLYG